MESTRAVIVCRHIAECGAPVKYAIRSSPLQEEDSGWQFLCAESHLSSQDAQVWSVREIIEYDQSVAQIIDQPPGVSLEKADQTTNKRIQFITNQWRVRER